LRPTALKLGTVKWRQLNVNRLPEFRPWLAEASSEFCQRMGAGAKRRWDSLWLRNAGIPAKLCPVLQTAQNDMIHIPAAYIQEWVEVVRLMDSSGMNFHHIFGTAAVGLAPVDDIEVLLSYYLSSKNCSWQLHAYPHWHGFHPCKF
ncbi:unnamed protein product, partial [Symbiodinium pilosum]